MTDTKIDPKILAEAERQLGILSRGTAEIVPEGGLLKKLIKSLETKKPLKIKLGADPTAPDLHLGHTVILNKMRQFQDLGHKVQFLIGDYTALIGDPAGRNKTRPPLSEEQIAENAKTYLDQAHKILDTDPEKLEILQNSTWLSKLSFADTIKLCAKVTVAQIIQREDFSNRLSNNTPISMHELLYPIMQGYDSVAMTCDIELGGTDQTFNCLMGRQLMQGEDMSPQIVITFPLLEGLDGKDKMSKSKNNYIAVEDAPNDMFGKVMSIPDEIMPKYFELLTNVTDQPNHPMEAKKLLANILVTRFHSKKEADAAHTDFETRFSKREVPTELPEHTFDIENNEIGLAALLVQLNFASSNGEGMRLIKQNAVKINGEVVNDPKHFLQPSMEPLILQAGKRRMAKIFLKKDL